MTQPADPTILAFDTSGPFCAVAIFAQGRVIAEAHVDMARGQAEALMPMVADLMAEAHVTRRQLDGVAVGTGPGNFTGLRIAVSAARGMALGLGRPAIGITGFEALLHQSDVLADRLLISLPAPRDQVYVQLFRNGLADGAPRQADPAQPGPFDAASVLGAQAGRLSRAIGASDHLEARLRPPAPAIARIASERLLAGAEMPRPVPLYIRAPDAAPARDRAPVILP